jgi:hypothetical protein
MISAMRSRVLTAAMPALSRGFSGAFLSSLVLDSPSATEEADSSSSASTSAVAGAFLGSMGPDSGLSTRDAVLAVLAAVVVSTAISPTDGGESIGESMAPSNPAQ